MHLTRHTACRRSEVRLAPTTWGPRPRQAAGHGSCQNAPLDVLSGSGNKNEGRVYTFRASRIPSCNAREIHHCLKARKPKMIIRTMTMKPMPPSMVLHQMKMSTSLSQIRTIDSLLCKRSRPLHGLGATRNRKSRQLVVWHMASEKGS